MPEPRTRDWRLWLVVGLAWLCLAALWLLSYLGGHNWTFILFAVAGLIIGVALIVWALRMRHANRASRPGGPDR